MDRTEARQTNFWYKFFKSEMSAGIFLVFASLLAILIANTQLNNSYNYILNYQLFQEDYFSLFHLPNTLLLIINDFLMAIFFLLVAMEIKREFLRGELSTRKKAVIPFIAAIFGMVFPAIIFVGLNMATPENFSGWAIPSATDIAFAICAVSLLGKRVPITLKVFLVAIAIIDDLGAIVIIAIFYSKEIHIEYIFLAALFYSILLILNKRNITNLIYYLLIGLVVWFFVLQSGIHATIAGVLLAFAIPLKVVRHEGGHQKTYRPLRTLESKLLNPVDFFIIPLFGFANAGVNFDGMQLTSLLNPLTLGVILGLFIGKQIGIFLGTYLCVLFQIGERPSSSTWLQIYGISVLCGIGFTMSLFIGNLSFVDSSQITSMKLGVLAGSFLSVTLGYTILRVAPVSKEISLGESQQAEDD